MGVKVLSSSDILKHLTGAIDPAGQTADGVRQVALTVRAIYKQEGPGHLDFDGSAYVEGPRSELELAGDDSGDAGWWLLDPGDYLVAFNEQVELGKGIVAMVRPHTRALVNGIEHPTLALGQGERLPIVPLRVAERGARVARNARISTLLLLD